MFWFQATPYGFVIVSNVTCLFVRLKHEFFALSRG